MKLLKYLYIGIAAASIYSCSDWTETERKVFEGQDEVHRHLTILEAQSEEDLMPSQREYFAKLREYRKTPHVRGFGWFGNWTGKGTNEQNYLKMLPDSVDFVSLWGTRGNLSDEQKADLKFFQDVKGGKALLCWIIQDIGSGITPEGENLHTYWLEKAGGDKMQATIDYANAICDTIEKYNLDGFDIDYEPGYGHTGTLANYQEINGTSGNTYMQAFIETMSGRLRPAGRMLVMDGQPDLCSTETSNLIDFYIYQAYWESYTNAVINKINRPKLVDWETKTIVTVEFEQGWRTGGIRSYSSVKGFTGNGAQIFDYATLDLPSGKRIGGVGTYHMEYDFANDPPYKWLRTALYYGNQVYPGTFE